MFLLNRHPDYRSALHPGDVETLGPAGADAITAHLEQRENHRSTPLHSLPGLAAALGIGALTIKAVSYTHLTLPTILLV